MYGADGRQREWRRVGELFANVKLVNIVPHSGSGVKVRADRSYRRGKQVHLIDGKLNAEIPEESPRPSVMTLSRIR